MPEPRTVLITGSSSGIGRATAVRFQSGGWNVIATMRTPEKETQLNQLENVICLTLDVTKRETIVGAITGGITKFGEIDVVVNNAGYGLAGPFEGGTTEQIGRQFDTNVFGPMAVIKAILPHFRSRRQGLIVNVASMGGRLAVPLYSVYHATKWAVEGFSESLRYELEPLGIQVKLIEPGAIATEFGGRSADSTSQTSPIDYRSFTENAFANMRKMASAGTSEMVANVIFEAATDGSSRLRYIAGTDAKQFLGLRWFLPESVFAYVVRSMVLKPAKA